MKIGNREFEKIPKFFILKAENWAGFYVDGELVYEDHEINNDILAEYAKLDFDSAYEDGLDLVERSGFPDKLRDLPRWVAEDTNDGV